MIVKPIWPQCYHQHISHTIQPRNHLPVGRDISSSWMPHVPRVRHSRVISMGAELFWDFFFWLGVVLGLSRLLFGKTQGWKAGSCGFFRTFGGGFRAVQAPFWGNQWWNAGSIQVWTQNTASKSKLSRSFLFSACIYLCWCVCVCVRVCSMCFLSVVVLFFHSMHFFSCICNLSI